MFDKLGLLRPFFKNLFNHFLRISDNIGPKGCTFSHWRFIDGAAKLLQDVERRCQERVQLGRDTAEEKAQFVQVLMEYKQRRAATVFVAHIMRFIMICHSLSVANKFGEWQHL